MKILYIGGGYVGTCSAAVSADSGHEVLVYDINNELIEKLSSKDKDIIESALFEKGLGEFIIRNTERLKFSSQLGEIESFINETQAIFLCLPTPEKDSSGETDLSVYNKAVEDLAQILVKRNKGEQSQYILIVNKSTVPIEMVDKTKEILNKAGVSNFGVASNPEFLVEGKAMEYSIKPERVVVGANDEKDFKIMREIYNRFCQSTKITYIEVNPYEAAAGKLIANFILFNRLANCFDVAGRVCEKFENLHFENIRKILASDSRITDWGFYNSLFAGGSCFIKDTRSLGYQLSEKGAEIALIKDTLAANHRQLDNFLNRAEKELAFNWENKKIGLLGLAFKRDTNDIRNSASLGVTEFLLQKNIQSIKAYDPVAGANFLRYFSKHPDFNKIILVKNEAEAINQADVLLIATDLPQFRELTLEIKKNLPNGALIMDGRRMLQHKYDELAGAGFNIIAVGSPLFKAVNN